MCDTFSSAHSSPSSSIASFAYHNSTQSILARAHESYMLHWSPSARSPSGASAGSGPSPRKRVQMDDDDDDEVILPLSSQQGLVGAEAYDDTMMDEDGDETMIMMMEDGDVPSSSRSMTNITTRHGIPPLSFSNSNSSGSNSSSSSSSSASDMFFAPRTESTSSSSTITSITQNRQMKTMPKRRGALGKTQSLPVDAFISQIGNTQNQIFVPDVFNATDGF